MTNSARTELRDCRSVARPSRRGAGTQDLGRGARESDSSWSFSAALWSPASPGCGFPYFCNGYDVASASGDPPTFDWSVLREPSLVFPSPLVFPGLLSSVSSSSLGFHGFPWRSVVLLAHEDPFLGQLQNNGTGEGGGRAPGAL